MSAPPVRIVVRLPYNRPHSPDAAPPDPPHVEWTPEKAEMFWRVYYQSRSNENRGADWRALAAHLEVPLPYLLYRVNAKLQEDIRGLKDIQGSLSPATKRVELSEDPGQAGRRLGARPYSSIRLAAPLGVRARLNSLGQHSPKPRKVLSSSTLTVQSPIQAPIQHESPSSSDDDSEEEELARKEEEAERIAEQQEALDRKLKDLRQMMTKETLGIVSSSKPRTSVERGRLGLGSPSSTSSSYRQDATSSRSASQSISNTSSPQGSIPEIPSPSQDSQPHSPVGRYLSTAQSSSPPVLSRNVPAQSRRHRPVAERNWSEQGSNQGSETTSSFSDLSDGSISASESAIASAMLSNIRGQGSRFSQYAPTRFSRGGPPY